MRWGLPSMMRKLHVKHRVHGWATSNRYNFRDVFSCLVHKALKSFLIFNHFRQGDRVSQQGTACWLNLGSLASCRSAGIALSSGECSDLRLHI